MKLEAKQRLQALADMTDVSVKGVNNMIHNVQTQASRLKPLNNNPSDYDRNEIVTAFEKIITACKKAQDLAYEGK
jgi:hypothetical protein